MNKIITAADKNEFALEVAKEAIRQFKLQEEKNEKKTVFRNTRVLLKHYNEFKEHCEDSLDEIYEEASSLNKSDLGMIVRELQEDVIIDSIVRTRSRTFIMVQHIDTCLHVLRKSMAKANTFDKFEVLNIFYLDPDTCKRPLLEKTDIAIEKLHISDRTVRRYELDMIEEMSVLLFGIGASKLMK